MRRRCSLQDSKLEWADAITPMMKARAVKNQDERECMRIVGAISEAGNWEFMKFLTPVLTENQLTAHIMEFLYNIPGMEDRELSRVGGQP
jgi:Xaa-Pro aminopeptidase